jgi:putative ABC transport system permease protein
VLPNFREIQSLKMVAGRFFNDDENLRSESVCVLGETAKVNLLGYDDAVGKWVKVNDNWLQVIGVMAGTGGGDDEGAQTISRNNLIIAPLNTVMRRFDDNMGFLKDEIDGVYLKLHQGTDSIETEGVVRAILASTHKDAGDFTVTVPAGLLKQKQETQKIFAIVMICIAGISLLVGGIGIMNIMLATVLERTREIGIRRAIGARQGDIIRQFMTEAVMISIIGGLIGIGFGFGLSRVISLQAGWPTVVTTSSISLAFGVSVFIGLVFGIYPAVQAAKLDPIEAIRYE